MKKTMKSWMTRLTTGAAIVVAALVAMPVLCEAAQPFRVAITVPAGGSAVYTNTGVASSAFASFRPEALVLGQLAATTTTVSYTVGNVTNGSLTKAVTATDRLLSLTNLPTQFQGDRIIISSTDTNGFTAYLIGTEQ
jgi:hypothetical protein